MSARAAAVRALALGALLAAGCAFDTVRQEVYPAMSEKGGATVTKVAIVSFGVRGDLARRGPENTTIGTEDVVKTITRFVSEELSARGVRLIPADDFAVALVNAGIDPSLPESRRPIANVAALQFGADGVLVGEVWRFRDRTGQSLAAASPASVGFSVTLYDAPAARRLWSGTFDETQHALSENVLNARRYPGGGTRWLTAEELAKWGAQEMSRSMPVSGGF
ncbi:MAG TPA: hypothetical protein VKB65_01725 [Myxococcota bacterium]|nr:hypothetical protein [Myxococcota bacterium]